MGIFKKLTNVVIAGAVGYGIIKLISKANENHEEEKHRKATPCHFKENLSKEQFAVISKKALKRYKNRLIDYNINGPIIECTFESQSGLSSWACRIDFNDYGHISGKYWIYSENDDSVIPEKIANIIKESILQIYSTNEDEPNAKKNIGTIATCFFILLISILIINSVSNFSKEIEIGISSQSSYNKTYEMIAEQLATTGFTNITLLPLDDLSTDNKHLDNIVESISINGNTTFSENTDFPYDSEIIIYYHSIKLLNPPLNSKDIRGYDCSEVYRQFQQFGFVNIKIQPINMNKLEHFVNDGEIQVISINGQTEFNVHTELPFDSEIIITYYVLK